MGAGIGIERRAPFSFEVLTAHEAGGGIVIVLIILSALSIDAMRGSIANGFRQEADAPVGISILQSLGHGLPLLVARDVTYLILVILRNGHQGVVDEVSRRGNGRDGVILRTAQASLERQIGIKAAVALHIGVHNDGHGIIANHRAGVVAGQFPHGQDAAFLILMQERVHVEGVLCRVDDGQQRMQGTEGIPQRESRVHGFTVFCRADFTIQAAVTPVHIRKE